MHHCITCLSRCCDLELALICLYELTTHYISWKCIVRIHAEIDNRDLIVSNKSIRIVQEVKVLEVLVYNVSLCIVIHLLNIVEQWCVVIAKKRIACKCCKVLRKTWFIRVIISLWLHTEQQEGTHTRLRYLNSESRSCNNICLVNCHVHAFEIPWWRSFVHAKVIILTDSIDMKQNLWVCKCNICRW